MKEIETDVLIVGSGLVGLVAAYSLCSLNYKITLVDKKNFFKSDKTFKDTRTVAVSEGSKQFLQNLSLWKHLEIYAEAIKTIKVYDRTPKNKIFFENQLKDKNLGYVIENKIFSEVLVSKLLKFKNINILYGFDLVDIQSSENYSKAFFNKTTINSKLIIAADGKNSKIKKIVGNKTYKKKYLESALVLNFFHEKELNSTAYEIFYKTGPLAILPMKSENNLYRSTVIWSNKAETLSRLIACKDVFITSFMEEKIGNITGKINKINSYQIFPLSAHINDSFANKRLIYVGDSAHSIHPIAGQGWNLGVNDVKNLYELCKGPRNNIGNYIFCNSYNDKTYSKAFQLFQITDILNSHFKNNKNIYRVISFLGFSFIDNKKVLKNKITKYAMGIS